MNDPIEWEDANVSDFLYLLRNEAGRTAKQLSDHVIDMRKALHEAEDVLARLNRLAGNAEAAAQLVGASDIEPNTSADIPERSGLTRKETQ